MAAGVNVALCPWLLYTGRISVRYENRAISPRRKVQGGPKRPFPDSFSALTSRLPVGPQALVSFQPSPAPISMFGKALSRESRLITLLCVMLGPRAVYTYVIFLEFYFCRSGYESSMTTGPRTIDATMDYLQTCLIFYLLILCFCGGHSIDICE